MRVDVFGNSWRRLPKAPPKNDRFICFSHGDWTNFGASFLDKATSLHRYMCHPVFKCCDIRYDLLILSPSPDQSQKYPASTWKVYEVPPRVESIERDSAPSFAKPQRCSPPQWCRKACHEHPQIRSATSFLANLNWGLIWTDSKLVKEKSWRISGRWL